MKLSLSVLGTVTTMPGKPSKEHDNEELGEMREAPSPGNPMRRFQFAPPGLDPERRSR
jgi:hypothetical protein